MPFDVGGGSIPTTLVVNPGVNALAMPQLSLTTKDRVATYFGKVGVDF